MKELKCPHCNEVIDSLDFDVTATCSSQMYQCDVTSKIPTDYDIDCLTDNVEYDNFRFPCCNELVGRGTEDDARAFLKGELK